MHRVEDVIDVWFDSGAMPFAQHHYPFENSENFFEDLFPADFINEGIDQTRGWFYSLMAISVLITGKAPYKNVLVNDLILDKEGKKMSKSRGNTLDPFELFDEYGADVVRYYSVSVSPPWIPTRFDLDGLREVESRFFRTLKATYNFFQLYANTDGINPKEYPLVEEDLQVIDKWILSKYNNLLKSYSEDMDIFEYTRAVRDVSHFLIEDLSNWYIRRNRRRFWGAEITPDKKAVYKVTYEILVGIIKLMAPFTPFITESLYNKLVGEESVHLETIPEHEERLIDEKLEEQMDMVRRLVTLGRASRERVQIKVRQPIREMVIDGKHKELIQDYEDLLKEELNVKKIVFADDLTEFMNYELKPNFKEAGSVLGKNVQTFAKFLAQANPVEIIELAEKGELVVDFDGEEMEIPENFLDIRVSAKEGFDVELEGGLFTILDTELDDELLAEGYAREFISQVQQMRRAADLEVTDNINIFYSSDDVMEGALEKHKDMIMAEVLALGFTKEELDCEPVELNEKDVWIEIEKA